MTNIKHEGPWSLKVGKPWNEFAHAPVCVVNTYGSEVCGSQLYEPVDYALLPVISVAPEAVELLREMLTIRRNDAGEMTTWLSKASALVARADNEIAS